MAKDSMDEKVAGVSDHNLYDGRRIVINADTVIIRANRVIVEEEKRRRTDDRHRTDGRRRTDDRRHHNRRDDWDDRRRGFSWI
ncbi:hypothetical protein [Neobacillus niacini]|uniref:hypothetical protein n=1 Tax=Neobacillus niacini TaxID=86668 RepID=UPI0021CB67D1|nr:hypothetical protein [Neobacillus niacini]MCM3765173.1 hypothetical protein [Neobacillus niacini]